MKRALDEGLSAAEAAHRALAPARSTEAALRDARERLLAAARAYDEAAVHSALDQALAGFALETVLRELILPALRQIGDEWDRGELEVGEEHFATTLIRERLLSLSRLWGRGGGPLAILACAPDERHDIGLIAFGLVLRSHGWRILLLGADTPIDTLAKAAAAMKPQLVVVASMDGALLDAVAGELRRLAPPRSSCSPAPEHPRSSARGRASTARRRPRGRSRERRASMTSRPRILLSGATGYARGRLLTALLERGEDVRCLARRPEAVPPHPRTGSRGGRRSRRGRGAPRARNSSQALERRESPAQVRAVERDATVVPVPSEHEHIREDLPGEKALRDEAQPEIPAFAVAVVAPAPDPLVLEGLVDGEAVE
jgi:methanogenic corrinoid protein MtbC1